MRAEDHGQFTWAELVEGCAGVTPFYLTWKRGTGATSLPSYSHIISPLGNDCAEVVAKGELPVCALWDGFPIISSRSWENLLRHRPVQASLSEAEIAGKFHGIRPTALIQKPSTASKLLKRVELSLSAAGGIPVGRNLSPKNEPAFGPDGAGRAHGP